MCETKANAAAAQATCGAPGASESGKTNHHRVVCLESSWFANALISLFDTLPCPCLQHTEYCEPAVVTSRTSVPALKSDTRKRKAHCPMSRSGSPSLQGHLSCTVVSGPMKPKRAIARTLESGPPGESAPRPPSECRCAVAANQQHQKMKRVNRGFPIRAHEQALNRAW